ncbi:hypothetical protein OKW33_000426 [Paraburkholderia atlantica]
MNAPLDSLHCAVRDCPGFASVKAGGVWICPQHAAAGAQQCAAVARWCREHAWWLHLIQKVQSIPPHEWTGEKQRWQSVAGYCERHGRSDLAPASQTVDVLPHLLCERDSAPLWVNRALCLFFENCMAAMQASGSTSALNDATGEDSIDA